MDPIGAQSYVDDYASRISRDLDDSWGCGQNEHARLDALERDLAAVDPAHAEPLFERLKQDGQFPRIVELIGDASIATEKISALDAVTRLWSGQRVAEFSREFERTGHDSEVVVLSRSVAKQDSVKKREDYINALASRATAVPKKNGWALDFSLRADPNSLAVANVWASLKDETPAFERVAEKINVGNAVAASINEVMDYDLWNGRRIGYSTGELADLLEGAGRSHGELRDTLYAEATAAIDEIKLSPFTSAEKKAEAMAPVTAPLAALREQLVARGLPVEVLTYNTPDLAGSLVAALNQPGDKAARVNDALESSNIYLTSRAVAWMSDQQIRTLALDLSPDFLSLRTRGDVGEDIVPVIQRIDGVQLGRMARVYMHDEQLTDKERTSARVALTGLAEIVRAYTVEADDKMEFMQAIVPSVGPKPLKIGETEIPNPESAAVAILLVGLSAEEGAFNRALPMIPLGEPLNAVLTAATQHAVEGNKGEKVAESYQLTMLKSIIDGATRSDHMAWKCQISSDTQSLLKPIKSHGSVPREVEDVETSLRAMHATMGTDFACRK